MLWIYFLGLCFVHFIRQPRLKIIHDGCGEPYLIRFYLFHLLGFSLKLHVIIRPDAEREMHDHPWHFLTYMIAGGYFEEAPKNPKTFKLGHEIIRKWYGKGTLRFCRAPYPHRLELRSEADPYDIEHTIYGTTGKHVKPQFLPAITLVLSWPRFRKWGFYGKDNWIPHDLYQSGDCE